MQEKLKTLFQPKTVALVGATDREGAFGWFAAKGLIESDIEKYYFINVRRDSVLGVKTYHSLGELPECPDVLLVATPAAGVNAIVGQAGELGIKNVVVFSSGFSEDRRNGQLLENELIQIADKYQMQIVGPNGIGILNNVNHLKLWGNSGVLSEQPCKRGVAVLAHSGGYAQEMFSRPYIDLAYAISIGNGNIVTIEEAAEYCLNDPAVTAVGMYVEGFKKPEAVYRLFSRAVELRKPVIILKSGRSKKGAISAASHTGNLAGSNEIFDAVFEKYGIIHVDTVEEFYGMIQIFGIMGANVPTGNKFAVINRSGGETTMSADLAERFDVDLPDFTEDTKEKLSGILPEFATAKNPLDITADALGDKKILQKAFQLIGNDGNVDAIIAAFPFEDQTDPNIVFDINAYQGEPVIEYRSLPEAKPVFMIPQFEAKRSEEWRYKLKEAEVPILPPGEIAYSILGKLSKWISYQPHLRRLGGAVPCLKNKKTVYSEYESKMELKRYGIDIPDQWIARSKEELEKICSKIEYPVVIKINSEDIMHKTEAGGVQLNIPGKDEALNAFDTIMDSCRRYKPDAGLDGVLVQSQAKSGCEIIIGIKNDGQFGPMLLVGMGGIFAEIFKDSVLIPCPMSKDEAVYHIRRLKSARLLEGYRGLRKYDMDALADLMVQVSEYAVENKDELTEMDLNPVFLYPEGEGYCIVDALIIK